MTIRVYIDDSTEPFTELQEASERFELDTTKLADGVHRLRFETRNNGRVTGFRDISFTVRNGPGIAVGGLTDGDEVRGRLNLVANASDGRIDSNRATYALETHRGFPLWMGVFALAVLLVGALYIITDPLRYRAHESTLATLDAPTAITTGVTPASAPASNSSMHLALTEGSFLPVLAFDASQGNAGRGSGLYATRCGDCHGAAAQGQTLDKVTLGNAGIYPRLAGQPAAYLYRQLVSFARGLRISAEMQPMAAALSEQDRIDIAVHLAGLQTPYAVAPAVAQDVLAIGRALATQGRDERGVSRCDGCHGPDAIGVAPNFPYLMGQNAKYLADQIAAWRTGTRKNSLLRLMEPVARGLEPGEIEAVARYYESLRPGTAR